jgi:membrane protease YdiL (CAAX protease family)
MMENLTEERALHPVASIGVFVATIFLGFAIIGPIIGFFLALPFYPGNILELVDALGKAQTTEDIRIPILIMQACASGIGLIVIPVMAYRFIVKEKPATLLGPTNILIVGLTALSVVLFMFPNSVIIDWNANVNFGGGFWDWAREKEELATVFTRFITTFASPGEFLIGLFVIAVLPAVGEEFAFRGWLQPAIQKITGNPHVAIWISAFLFSALHMQFFGFVPRMLLGGLFGYLMVWSNNLWVPIAAHFVNNGLSVLMIYLHQQGLVDMDVESTEALPWMYVIPVTVIFVGLMVQVRKQLITRV